MAATHLASGAAASWKCYYMDAFFCFDKLHCHAAFERGIAACGFVFVRAGYRFDLFDLAAIKHYGSVFSKLARTRIRVC